MASKSKNIKTKKSIDDEDIDNSSESTIKTVEKKKKTKSKVESKIKEEPTSIKDDDDLSENEKQMEIVIKPEDKNIKKTKTDYKGKLMYIKTPYVIPFKTQIEVLSGLITEIMWVFTGPDPNKKDDDNKDTFIGLEIADKDSSRTIYVKERLYASEFTEYYCKGTRQEFGINMVILSNLLKSIDKDDILTMYVEESNKQILYIETEHINTKRINKDKLKLMDLAPPHKIDRKIEIDAKIIMPSVEFHKRCKLMSAIGEYLEIKCTNKNIIFTCKGDCVERCTVYKADEGGVNITTSDKQNPVIVQGIFELKNIVLFYKCASLCNDIQVFMKNDYALSIVYTIATLGTLTVALSPIKEENIKNMSYEDSDDDEVSLIASGRNNLD